MKKHTRNREEEVSFGAKVSRNVISKATSMDKIGHLIQDGTFRKKVTEVEPPWHCPKDFSVEHVDMGEFSMEFLTHHEESKEECLLREVVLQLHGGGYIGKMKNAYRDFAVLYAKMEGRRAVLSVDYRVAPEHPFPAALEDAVKAYQWLLDYGYQAEQIIVAGDSAGGGLALALAFYLKDHKISLPKKMVLMSPWTDLTASGESYQTNFDRDPLFGHSKESMLFSKDYYGEHDPKDYYISPLFGDYRELPPLLFQVGSLEMLLSDSLDAAKKAKEAGCQVQLTVYKGMFHVFQMGMHRMRESKKAWEEVEQFLCENGK